MIKQDGQNSADKLAVKSINSKDNLALRGSLTYWTDEEIVKLNEAVELFGNNWELVSKHVGRSN
jgi:hypothetical protein